MKLADYQRRLLALSFARDVREDELAALGDPARFRLYRHMIRARFLAMAKVAFRGSCTAVGERAFEASFARYLEAEPPRTPLIRDVIAAFGSYALEDRELIGPAPAFTRDLLRFEQAKWRVAYQPGAGERAGELDFEAAPVLNPTLQQLDLSYAVHDYAGGECRVGEFTLLLYRPPANDDVRWYPADALLAAVLDGARARREATLATLVRTAAERLGRSLDPVLLEELATSLTVALERGVVLGSRSSA